MGYKPTDIGNSKPMQAHGHLRAYNVAHITLAQAIEISQPMYEGTMTKGHNFEGSLSSPATVTLFTPANKA